MAEILTQAEIDVLLSGLEAVGRPDGSATTSELIQETDPTAVRPIDLGREEKIVRGRLPALETIFERFARSMRPALTSHIGTSCQFGFQGLELLKYGLYTKKLPLPSSLHIWRMPPLKGQALLVLSSTLAFALVDCMFGGNARKGRVEVSGREFSAIENRILSKIALTALEELRQAWQPVHAVDMVYVRAEYNPLSLSIAVPSDIVAVATFGVDLEQQSSELQIAIPLPVLDGIKEKLRSGLLVARLQSDAADMRRLSSHMLKTEVSLSVELASGKITVRDLMAMKIGDVLELTTDAYAPAIAKIEGVPKLTGMVGAHRGSKALRVTGALTRSK